MKIENKHPKINIAILGATSHIAKGLIFNFLENEKYSLHLYARSLNKLAGFIEKLGSPKRPEMLEFGDFEKNNYDIIINCIGVGDPAALAVCGAEIFTLTEDFDNLIIRYLKNKASAVYINLSSGAVYGRDFDKPADSASLREIDVNRLGLSDAYSITKLNSEAKHRAYESLNIVDLRIFGYYSRFISIDTNFFLSSLLRSLIKKEAFLTNQHDIIRDYVSPSDLAAFVERCFMQESINQAFDVYSLAPVKKFEILDYFAKDYGLKYEVTKDVSNISITGIKMNYYSENKTGDKIGYFPKKSSLDTIIEETNFILLRKI